MRVLGFEITNENITESTTLILIINYLIENYPLLCISVFLMYFFKKQIRRFFDIFLDKLDTIINN